MNKGYKATQAREVLEKPEAAGLPYVVNYLNGAAGHGHGLENGRNTAKLYDGLHPTMINMSMLTIVPGTPLWRMIQKGLYEESTEKEKLEGTQGFIRNLTNETIFMNEHASNVFHVQCNLPEGKDAVIDYIQKIIDTKDESVLRDYRDYITQVF